MSKTTSKPDNAPSTTINKSSKGRGNNPHIPKNKSTSKMKLPAASGQGISLGIIF